jgi:RNA recognition motif-containing protein
VNFETHQQALEAKKALNGKQLLPGTNYIRIEFYRKDNKFLGVYKGLDRKELITNTHYRVLFIRGLDYNVSVILLFLHFQLTKEQLHEMCTKFGQVDVITLKTKVDEGEIKSRGIAIVQFNTKE